MIIDKERLYLNKTKYENGEYFFSGQGLTTTTCYLFLRELINSEEKVGTYITLHGSSYYRACALDIFFQLLLEMNIKYTYDKVKDTIQFNGKTIVPKELNENLLRGIDKGIFTFDHHILKGLKEVEANILNEIKFSSRWTLI